MAHFEIDPGHKILRFHHELEVLDRGGVPAVLNVELDLSETCNLNCRNCDFPNRPGGFLAPATEEAVVHCLKLWGARAVVLTGGGEPTMHPDWQNIANRLSRHFELGMYTNGVLLSLSACPDAFRWVYVSLDAYDAKSWSEYKRAPQSLFTKVLANIEAAAQYTTVGVGFLIGEDNYRDIPAMAVAGIGTGASYVHFRPRWPCQSSEWAPEARSLLATAATMPTVFVPWDKFEAAWHWQRPYKRCWASMFIRQIDARGDVFVCPTTRWRRPLGNVTTVPVVAEPVPVTAECRELCRGHAMNLTLDRVMQHGPHDNFV